MSSFAPPSFTLFFSIALSNSVSGETYQDASVKVGNPLPTVWCRAHLEGSGSFGLKSGQLFDKRGLFHSDIFKVSFGNGAHFLIR